jgi:hypothetical protein
MADLSKQLVNSTIECCKAPSSTCDSRLALGTMMSIYVSDFRQVRIKAQSWIDWWTNLLTDQFTEASRTQLECGTQPVFAGDFCHSRRKQPTIDICTSGDEQRYYVYGEQLTILFWPLGLLQSSTHHGWRDPKYSNVSPSMSKTDVRGNRLTQLEKPRDHNLK